MPLCPVCETEYQDKAEFCSACGWDLGDNQQAKLAWARQQWQKSKAQLHQFNQDRAQFKRHWQEVLAKLDQIQQPAQPPMAKTIMRMGKQFANIQMQLQKTHTQHSLLEERLTKVEQQLFGSATKSNLDDTQVISYEKALASIEEEQKHGSQTRVEANKHLKKQQIENLVENLDDTQLMSYDKALASIEEEEEKERNRNMTASQQSSQDEDETMISPASEKIVEVMEALDEGMDNIDVEPEVIFFQED